MDDYLAELDDLLLNQLDDGMLLSELDGYLTGLIVSPDLVPQSQWFKPIWGGSPPNFANTDDLQHFLDLLMRHYNSILDELNHPGDYTPIFDMDTRTGETLWEFWVDGFSTAMKLAPRGWNRIHASDDAGPKAALAGITRLVSFADSRATLDREEQDRWDTDAPNLIPIWVQLLHEWRMENDKNRLTPAKSGKVGRNDPCPCGSGKKYKKCCGLN